MTHLIQLQIYHKQAAKFTGVFLSCVCMQSTLYAMAILSVEPSVCLSVCPLYTECVCTGSSADNHIGRK